VKHEQLGQVIAVANQKGGVGKTTTSINIAASLAALDKRVLLVDMDPQGNSSTGLGIEKSGVGKSVYDVLMGECPLHGAMIGTVCEGLYLVPASIDLAGAEVELVSAESRERRLATAFSAYTGKSFDYVFIDCPPALNLLTINALSAVDSVLITLQTEFYAMEGLTQLMDTIRLIRNNLNPELEIGGILLTMVDHRNNLSAQVTQEVRDYFGNQVYANVVPRNVRLSEAPSFGLPVMHYDVHCKGAQAYLAVAQEMLEREHMRRRAS